MASTRPIKSLLARAFAAALTLGAASCSVYPAAPAGPAFDTDVLPIFEAHCTRCHDNNLDGGGASHEVFRPDASGGPVTAGAPHLSVYGPCYPAPAGGPSVCYSNAAAYHTLIHTDIHRAENDPLRMPLPPARPLDDWEINVIDAWVAEQPLPICSNSAHPDPALLCP
jgi:hypothetical protein